MVIETVKKMEDSSNNLTGYLVNNVMTVPLDEGNRHYVEILKQVDEGTITIAEAD
tara:strand:- start:338 stop:502 length:165 start_codon:yes stop_codon:yes gene_type:complete